MGLSNPSAASGGSTTYITKFLSSGTACEFTSNFCGNLVTFGSCTMIKADGQSSYCQMGTAGADVCNILLAGGASVCFAGAAGLLTGYLFDT